MRMFLAILGTIAKNWKSNQMSINNQNVVYSYKGILSTIKRNKLLVHATTWMNLKSIMESERSQIQKLSYYVIPFIRNF